MDDVLLLAGLALAGTLVAVPLSCLPGLHVYTAAGLVVALAAQSPGTLPGDRLAMFMLGLLVGYAVLNTVPAVFAGTPDESTLFVVLPGQRYLLQGRGVEAAVVTGAGSLGGLLALLLLAPVLPRVLPVVRAIVAPHLHWILGAVALYLLLSEWPKGFERGKSRAARLAEGWRTPGIGLLTFGLSGLLGLALFYRSPLPPTAAYQSLFPAFTGLFAIPWLLVSLRSGPGTLKVLPSQEAAASLDLTPGQLLRGVAAGTAGGLFAAFFPAVTGGIGGLLAGQATAQRDDRLFLVSQGACKVVYYVGAYLLLFVPGLHLSRGGLAALLGILYTPHTPAHYWTAVGCLVLCGALALALLPALSRGAGWLVARAGQRLLSAAVLALLVGLLLAISGPAGLLVAAVSTAVGLVPLLWGARRSNCLGVLLVPLTLQMAGLGPAVAALLGLD